MREIQMEKPSEQERLLCASFFKKSVETLLKNLETDPEPIKVIKILSDLLGFVVDRALDLVDNVEIKLLRSQKTGREIFEIPGEEVPIHRLFTTVPFCDCKTFNIQVIQGEDYCCKHYLACRIARALKTVTVIELPHSEFLEVLQFFDV